MNRFHQGATRINGKIIDSPRDIPVDDLVFGDVYVHYWSCDFPDLYWSGSKWVDKEKYTKLMEERNLPEWERRVKRLEGIEATDEAAPDIKTKRRKDLERLIYEGKLPGWAVEELSEFWKFMRLLRAWRTSAFEESGEALAAMELCQAMDEYYKGTEDVVEDAATD